MRRGEITLKFLELAKEMAYGSTDLIAAFLDAGYGASYSKLEYALKKRTAKRSDNMYNTRKLRQRYFTLLSRLKHEGLVQSNNKGIVALTLSGRAKLKKLLRYRQSFVPVAFYRQASDEHYVIVAFDIPEKERRKRNWLRSVLRNLGLYMVQKSLWMGKVKLPAEFIRDLHNLHMDSYVEIFQVTKSGTLKHVV